MRAVTPSTHDGRTRNDLHREAKAGRWDRIARGIYFPADAPPADWDQIEAATRHPMATICLISALSHHELTDEIPDALHVAIPSGGRLPASTSIRWHRFQRETFDVGREETIIPGTTQGIGLHSAERAIVDAFRLRGALGYETGRDALKEWLRRGGKPARLMDIATQLPRSTGPVINALQMIA